MAPRLHPSRLLLTLGMSVTLAGAAPTQGSNPSAGIVGRIIDQTSHSPISGARVALLGTPRRTNTDSSGRFTQAALPSGIYLIEVRAIGYGVSSWVVRLDSGVVLDHEFEMEPSAYQVDPIVVEARPTFSQQRLLDFEQRRQGGRGVFVTERQIKDSKAASLVDVLRGLPGVRVACRAGGCVVEMTRAARGTCRPDWVMDGFPATQSSTPHLPTIGVVGIEIYRTVSETPAQFLKSDSQCGVIVIWTKSGP